MSAGPTHESHGGKRDVLALIGPRCAGKTTVGRALAARLGLPFVDLDDEVARMGRYAGLRAATAGELLAGAGAAVFRDLEAAAVKKLLEPSPRCVVATGGGVVERADNRAWLARSARCVYLRAPLAVLEARMRADPAPRPALGGGDAVAELGALLARREPLYRALAELEVDAGGDSPDAVAERIAAGLRRSG